MYVEKQIKDFERDWIILKQQQDYMKEKIEKIEEILVSFIKSADTKYAQKSSVDRLWAIVWAVIAFVFAGLGGCILTLLLK